MAATKEKRSAMSAEHKAALAEGRADSAALNRYLSVLTTPKKRGRRRTPDSIRRRLAAIDATWDTAPPLDRVTMTQERLDLEEELGRLTSADEANLEELEQLFVEAAPRYSERKGITHAAWREIGVPAGLLKRAGIAPGR